MILSNKYALVTGASSGIGQSISIQFAKEGANVYLIGRNEIGLKKTYKAITHWGGEGGNNNCRFE